MESLGNMTAMKKNHFVLFSGIIGDWKNHFTVALNEQFDKIYADEMKNSKLPIQFE